MALTAVRTLSRRGVGLRLMSGHSHAPPMYTEDPTFIGSREVVGFGRNGNKVYVDDECIPFPAIRYREEDSTIKPIREKEKGDWKKLTLEEKKALYRFSFCQTFSEISAPTSEWKLITGWGLIGISLAYVGFVLIGFLTPQSPEILKIYDYEHRVASMQRRLDMGGFKHQEFGPYWDIEKRDWKEGALEHVKPVK